MYSGKLDNQYGIPMLLEAFMLIEDHDAELWLTGSGNAEGYIKECASKDTRIKFYGFLPSRTEVLKKQNEAKALINMRLPSEPASEYCFPSKLFEYMATGIPVLSFRLGGIPEEYYQYLYLIDEESVAAVKKGIETALSSNCEIGEAAKEFILNNKTSEQQSRRILKWIKLKSD